MIAFAYFGGKFFKKQPPKFNSEEILQVFVVRNCRSPSVRPRGLGNARGAWESDQRCLSKGQGFTAPVKEEGTPRMNLERINGFSNTEKK